MEFPGQECSANTQRQRCGRERDARSHLAGHLIRPVSSTFKLRPTDIYMKYALPDHPQPQRPAMAATAANNLEEAALAIATADAMVIGTGAGMGVDSGLGTFRGRNAGGREPW